MANFQAVTASNGAKVKDIQAARKALEGFHLLMEDGTLEVDDEGHLVLHGYDWLDFVAVPDPLPASLVEEFRKANGHDPESWEDLWGDCFELKEWQDGQEGPSALKQLAAAIGPLLAERWLIQSIGNERRRFPLGAAQWTITPNGKLQGLYFEA